MLKLANGHELTIGETADKFNVSFRLLRFYEERGLISPRRQGTGRFYNDKDQARLQVIIKGKNLGFTLLEIAKLITPSKDNNDQELGGNFDLLDVVDPKTLEQQLGILQRKRTSIDLAIAEISAKMSKTKLDSYSYNLIKSL